MSSSAKKILALIGLILPYVSAALPIFIFRKEIGSTEYYETGALARFDSTTGWITFGGFIIGAALCWSWTRSRFVLATSPVIFIALATLIGIIQFIAVFAFRFFVYYQSGGIL